LYCFNWIISAHIYCVLFHFALICVYTVLGRASDNMEQSSELTVSRNANGDIA